MGKKTKDLDSILFRLNAEPENPKPGRPKDESKLELSTPSQLIEGWAKSVEGDLDRPLTTCLKSVDKDLRNKLRGTVAAYIGYGGTKKSLMALQGCRNNVLAYENNCTGIYSNMEMAIYQFMTRLIDMSFTVEDYVYNVSNYYEKIYETAYKSKDKEQMEQIKKALFDAFQRNYGNNLLINSRAGMTVDDFNKLLIKAKEINGTVDMLVIDGLSMMSGAGTETESYSTNSKELKDLAKLHNVYIPLICHVSKGAELHTRDVSKFIRGSEKILDNVDFKLMFSLLIDETRSTAKNIIYRTDKGFIKFHNKRGSGNTLDLIYDFDPATLTIKETREPAINYEVEFSKEQKSFF